MSENQLKLNPDKTHKLTVGTAKRLNSLSNFINVTMDGFNLEESKDKYETILGIEVQHDLKWTVYISNLRKKLSKRITGIYKIRKILPFQTLKMITE